jgi:hypothetical protein
MDAGSHFIHSTLRERIIEHVFVGDALRRLWQLGVTDVEVLRSEFDAGGYDLVMAQDKVVRHIQFKTIMAGGKAANTKVSLKLIEKPSGCVIWIILTPELHLQSYLWFGGLPGEPLPDIRHMKVAKHTKGNAKGIKSERRNLRIVPRRSFVGYSRQSPRRSVQQRIDTLDALLERLFGPLAQNNFVNRPAHSKRRDAFPIIDQDQFQHHPKSRKPQDLERML